jgi:hypothetical protein
MIPAGHAVRAALLLKMLGVDGSLIPRRSDS